MITKTVYSYDAQSRAYLRAITLDEGDLSPADLALGRTVWLIPGNCLEIAPPKPPAGQYVAEKNGEWVLKDIPKVDPPAPTPAPAPAPGQPEGELTIEQKAEKLLALVDKNMELAAVAAGYKTGLVGVISYAEEKAVPKYWAEGRMFRKWRSLTYARCYELLAKVVKGEIEEPTAETLPPMLPVLDWATCHAEQAALEAEQAAAAAPVAAPEPDAEA